MEKTCECMKSNVFYWFELTIHLLINIGKIIIPALWAIPSCRYIIVRYSLYQNKLKIYNSISSLFGTYLRGWYHLWRNIQVTSRCFHSRYGGRAEILHRALNQSNSWRNIHLTKYLCEGITDHYKEAKTLISTTNKISKDEDGEQ